MIWLVRHGESEANAGLASSDFASIPLTPLGRQQADAVANACKDVPDWIVHSAYIRARQTAEPTMVRHATSSVVELPVHEFTYLAPSRCNATTSIERRPLVEEYWARCDPNYSDGEGAESFAGLRERADSFLAWAEQQRGFGVTFTHSHFIRAVVITALSLSEPTSVRTMRAFFGMIDGMMIPNGSITRLRQSDGRWWVGAVDVSHLPPQKSSDTLLSTVPNNAFPVTNR